MDALDFPPELLEQPPLTRHRLTVDAYHRMAEAGVLPHDARVELIDGEIIDMAPIGTRHYWAVATLHRALQAAAGTEALVVAQAPLRLGDETEPEPDLVLLKPQLSTAMLPGAGDAFLVVEVADSTLAYDVRVKAPLYARHGVPEYWVLDLSGQRLLVFRRPQGDQWAEVLTLVRPATMALPGLDGAVIPLDGIF